MTESDRLPSAGSHVGRYLFLREIAKGPFGPLYELRAESEAAGLGGLGRLLELAPDLSPEAAQLIAEAAWDSMEIRHDRALCVADVVFGKGWITLIHDFSEGSLLRSLQRRAQERQSAFPLAVALRVVMDVLDALDDHREACESAAITWRPGGTSATSLYLCGDGRTRSLDGQLPPTLMRVESMLHSAASAGYPAPELLDPNASTDERTDVFAAGSVLWELLTGRELELDRAQAKGLRPRARVPNLTLSVPKGTRVIPQPIVRAVSAALDFDPTRRPPTREHFRQALLEGAEVASYEQVIDFTDALLHRESTLFRLTLDPEPKLSDRLGSDRPRSPQFEWALELAKKAHTSDLPWTSPKADTQAQANALSGTPRKDSPAAPREPAPSPKAEPEPTSKVPKLPARGDSRPSSKGPTPPPKPSSTVPQPRGERAPTPPPKPTSLAPQPDGKAARTTTAEQASRFVAAATASASDTKRNVPKHTLMGISPTGLDPQRAEHGSAKTEETGKASRAEGKPTTRGAMDPAVSKQTGAAFARGTKSVELTKSTRSRGPAVLVDPRKDKARHTPAEPAKAHEAAANAALASNPVVGTDEPVDSTDDLVDSIDSVESVESPGSGESVEALASAPSASPNHPAGSHVSNETNATRLLSAVLEEKKADLDRIRASLPADEPLVPSIQPGVPVAPAAAHGGAPPGSRVLELRLSTVAIGVVALIAVAVLVTILVQSSCSGSSSKSPSVASAAPVAASAPPPTNPSEVPAAAASFAPEVPSVSPSTRGPAGAEPSAEVTAPSPATSAPIANAAPRETPPANAKPNPETKPAPKSTPAAPKGTGKKRRNQYVPSEL